MKPLNVAITGASRGLGAALVSEGLAAGWDVVACVRAAERALPEWRRHPRLRVLEADLANADGVHELARRLNTDFPELDGLVNNAAVQYAYPVIEGALFASELETELRVNLISPLQLGHELMPLLAQNGGFIANVSSALAYVPKARSPVYAASKAALSHYTRSARLQAPGVRLLEIVLPLVDTDMTRGRGSPRSKLSPQVAARAILAGIDSRDHRLSIGMARFVPWLLRVLPESFVTHLLNRGDALPRGRVSTD